MSSLSTVPFIYLFSRYPYYNNMQNYTKDMKRCNIAALNKVIRGTLAGEVYLSIVVCIFPDDFRDVQGVCGIRCVPTWCRGVFTFLHFTFLHLLLCHVFYRYWMFKLQVWWRGKSISMIAASLLEGVRTILFLKFILKLAYF